MTDWEDIVFPLIAICLIVGIAILVFVAIDACNPKLTEGTVVDKEYIAAHTTTQTQYVFTGKVMIPRVITRRHPDRWRILVVGFIENGDEHSEWWDVGEALYKIVKIGDRVKRDNEGGDNR